MKTLFKLTFTSLIVVTGLFVVANPVNAQPIVAEAESFVPDKEAPGWKAGQWGENMYAATIANTFLSRKAFLGASETAQGAIATQEINVPTAGEYLALVRYEAASGFQTQFKLRVEQHGKVWERLYGARENIKIWAFNERLKAEVSWPWGANENMVWEGHDTKVPLQAGKAKLSLIAVNQPSPSAKRNVDLVLLTTDKADVDNRIAKESYLPLDGLLTQAGELYARVRNTGTAPLNLTISYGREHSPYWVHMRTWQPKTIDLAANATSDWVEVGSLLDTLNDGQWEWKTKDGIGNYQVEFGVPANGKITSIHRFNNLQDNITFVYDADTRRTHRVRLQQEVLYELLAELKKEKVPGKAPTKTLIFGYTFDSKPTDAAYTKAVKEFLQLMGTTAVSSGTPDNASGLTPSGLRRGYIDVRGQTVQQLEELGKKMQTDGTATNIAVISLGDEIGLPAPPADSSVAFRTWLQAQNVPLSSFGVDNWDAIEYSPTAIATEKPALFYYSRLYAHHYGIAQIKKLTDTLKQYFPNAGVGANFSPHAGTPYIGEAHKWSKLFREGGMTMPWSEDYAWQIPIVSPQASFFNVDLFRSGIDDRPDAKIQMYVMAHDPGNTPNMWRRMFYGALAHGTKIFNLYEVRPVQAAYTENYINSPLMYKQVQRTLHELGTFEEFVQNGKVLPAQVAIWHGETGDIWEDGRAPFGAAKGALYLALRHQQLPLDIVTESNDISPYKVLYIMDRHVSRDSSQAIANWVKNGGTVFATASAAMRDEFDKPNTVLSELFGVTEKSLDESKDPIRWIKQDLPTAVSIDTVKWNGSTLPALGAASRIESSAQVVATFANGAPATTTRTVEKGAAIYCAFLPGLSYFKPSIPNRPVDRGSTDDAMSHFLPKTFNLDAAQLAATAAKDIARPVVCSDALVESTVIQSPHGVLIPLINWHGMPIRNLRVEINGFPKLANARLGSGKEVLFKQENNRSIATLSLDVADTLILR